MKVLKLLSTISFSDSVENLDDKLDIKNEDKKGGLFLFSCLDPDFFCIFLLERFTISSLDEGELLFLFFDLYRLSCLLVEEVSRFSDTLFGGSAYELSPVLSFFHPASSLELTTVEITFASC